MLTWWDSVTSLANIARWTNLLMVGLTLAAAAVGVAHVVVARRLDRLQRFPERLSGVEERQRRRELSMTEEVALIVGDHFFSPRLS